MTLTHIFQEFIFLKLLESIEKLFIFKGKFCRFYGNAAMLSRLSCLERHKLDESWDIEDLVKVGKKAKVGLNTGQRLRHTIRLKMCLVFGYF